MFSYVQTCQHEVPLHSLTVALLKNSIMTQAENSGPQSSPALLGGVNQHYLNKVVSLSEVMPVVATEDIYDSHGTKLLAKGAVVSHRLQEKLILHKLRKPLETSLVVQGGVDSNSLLATAERLIASNSPLAGILCAMCASSSPPLSMFGKMEFGNAMTMMLTIMDHDGTKGFDHAVTVALLSMSLAKKMRLGDQEQKIVGLAGLLHDIGELYIDPAYLRSNQVLHPHDWGHVVVHPRVAELLIVECDNLPRPVARAVGEHHERYDGNGYPRHVKGNEISVAGQIVGMAELIAGLLPTERPIERGELAIRVFPGEFEHHLLSATSESLHLARLSGSERQANDQKNRADTSSDELLGVVKRLTLALDTSKNLLKNSEQKSPATTQLLEQTIDRVRTIQRAIVSTGMDIYLNQAQLFGDEDASFQFEKQVSIREIHWRLRGLARDIALRGGAKDDTSIFADLIAVLDDTSDANSDEVVEAA